MRIRFGINVHNNLRATSYAFALVILILLQFDFLYRLDRAHESVLQSHMPNVTSIEANLYCGIPYDDCRCSVVSTKYCLADIQLKLSRIMPLVLFVLQVYLTRELFSLSGDHTHLLVCILWITSMFIFTGILFIIYQDSCYYEDTVKILSGMGYLLFGSFVYVVGYPKSR